MLDVIYKTRVKCPFRTGDEVRVICLRNGVEWEIAPELYSIIDLVITETAGSFHGSNREVFYRISPDGVKILEAPPCNMFGEIALARQECNRRNEGV